jgi:hypothetical protein
MPSQQHKLLRLVEKQQAGKSAIVKVAGVPYGFVAVRWGGASPQVVLRAPDGIAVAHTAAEWKRLGAAL